MDAGGTGGAAGSIAGGGAGGGGGVSPDCANVACLQQVEDLMVGCAGDGSCVYHMDGTGSPSTNTKCYENGVKIQDMIDTSQNSTTFTLSSTFKVSMNGSLCYTRSSVSVTMDLDAGIGARYASDLTMQDASGTTIVTVHEDIDGVATVTCPGGSPSLVPASCGFSPLFITGGPPVKSTAATTCVAEVCTF